MPGAFEPKMLPLRRWLGTQSRLRRGEVHVILVRLPPPGRCPGIPPVLDAEERRRRRRFVFAPDRDRFALSHAVLRFVLGRYLGRRAATVQFARRADPQERPSLLPGARLRLRFSLSHAREFAAVAVACAGPIGIDVETAGRSLDSLAIAERHFAVAEAAEIARKDGKARELGFLDLWTAKEAILKALGVGLAHPLSDVVIGVDPRGWPRLRQIKGGNFTHRRFALYSLHPRSPVSASLSVAVAAGSRRVVFWAGDAVQIVRAADRKRPLTSE